MMNVLSFPTWQMNKAAIDWDALEVERLRSFSRVPKKAVRILRKMLEQKPHAGGFVEIDLKSGNYPPNPLFTPRTQKGIIWVLDLLDRFGGELGYGNQRCKVRRSKKKLPVFIVVEISKETYVALLSALGNEFEHFVQSRTWQMLGKDLPEVDLMVVLITGREDNGACYLGVFDMRTIMRLFVNLGDCLSIEDLIEWGL
jgi:hypothetical protein